MRPLSANSSIPVASASVGLAPVLPASCHELRISELLPSGMVVKGARQHHLFEQSLLPTRKRSATQRCRKIGRTRHLRIAPTRAASKRLHPNYQIAHPPKRPSFTGRILTLSSGRCRNVAGKEVVQVYFRQQYTEIETPTKRMIGFDKISLAAGAKQLVTFTIDVGDLGFYVNGDWVTESGNFTFYVGSSSRSQDLLPVSITL